MSIPTPSSAARPKATTAMIAPRISPTRISLKTIHPMSRKVTSFEGHRPDDQRDRLAADVAAGPDQERDEEAQRDDCRRARPRNCAGPCRCTPPRRTAAAASRPACGRGAGRSTTRYGTFNGWSRRALDVLGRLGLEDVRDVVLGDDPEQAVVVVDDRDGEQVALGQQAGGGLPVGVGPDPDGRGRHELADRRVRPGSAAAGTATARRGDRRSASTT